MFQKTNRVFILEMSFHSIMRFLRNYQSLIYIGIFFLCSLSCFLPYLNDFGYQQIASSGDFPFVLDIKEVFLKNPYVFRPIINIAHLDVLPWHTALYSPYLIFLFILSFFKISPLISTLFFIAAMAFVGCLSMYSFLLFFLKKRINIGPEYVRFASFIGAILYIFTPFFTRLIFPGHFLLIFSYAIFPLLLKYFDLFLAVKKINLKYLAIIFLLFLSQSIAFANMAVVVAYFSILFFYTLVISLFAGRKVTTALLRLFLTGLVFLLANIWWLVPTMLVLLGNFVALAGHSRETIGAGIGYATKNASILNIFIGRAEAELPITQQLNTNFFETFVAWSYFFLLLFILWQLIKSNKKQKSYYFCSFTILILTTVFFLKGLQPPGSQFFVYLYEHFSIFQVLRRPTGRIYWLFFFLFISMASVGIVGFLKACRIKLLKFLTIFILVITALVFVLIFGLTRELKPFNVPINYYLAKDYLNFDKVTKALILPDVGQWWPTYNQSLNFLSGWDFSGQIWNFKRYTPDHSAWELDNPERKKVNELAQNLYSGNSICPLTKELNISHIIVKHDVSEETYDSDILDLAIKNLNKSSDIEFSKEFPGSFTIYNLKKNCRSSLIQLTNSEITFQKINPTKFKIYINKLISPENLSYLEAFNTNWKLYLRPDPGNAVCHALETYNLATECKPNQKFFQGEEVSYLWQKPIFNDTHVLANEYANSWTIDPEYIKKNYSKDYYRENPDGSIDIELVLYFKLQSYFYLGSIISGTALLSCLSYLGYDWRKNGKLKSKSCQI